jgi:ABC-type multidrug transport system fused ATPase/permease subunit
MSPNATKIATPTHGLVNVPPKKGGPSIESLPTAIEVEKMSFYYSQTQALFDISVKLPAKLVTAFIGPSGCGKSTFLRTINRMNDIIPATARISTDLTSIQSPFGATLAWCFRSPTRSRSRSTTTSPMACA